MTSFDLFFDGGHGWLGVHKSWLDDVGVRVSEISEYSYRHPGENTGLYYLEEDCDADLFIRRYRDKYGVTPQIKAVGCGDQCFVRAMPRVHAIQLDWQVAQGA